MVDNIAFEYSGDHADQIREAWLKLDALVTERVLPWPKELPDG